MKLDYRRKIKKYFRASLTGSVEFSDEYNPDMGYSGESSMIDIHEIFETEQDRKDFVIKQKEFFQKITDRNNEILKDTAEFLSVNIKTI